MNKNVLTPIIIIISILIISCTSVKVLDSKNGNYSKVSNQINQEQYNNNNNNNNTQLEIPKTNISDESIKVKEWIQTALKNKINYFYCDFDNLSYCNLRKQLFNESNIKIVNKYNESVARFFVAPKNPGVLDDIKFGKDRTEVYNRDLHNESLYKYGFRFLIPKEFKLDRLEKTKYYMIAQWHDVPEDGIYSQRDPPIFICLNNYQNDTYINVFYGMTDVFIKKIERDTWINFETEINWSTNNGSMKVWINNESIKSDLGFVTVRGPNLYNNLGNYYKIGLYRGYNFTTSNSLYFDKYYYEKLE